MTTSVLSRIKVQLEALYRLQGAGGDNTGLRQVISVLIQAQGRIEHLEKIIDQRLPTEAEIALQLLPAVINADPHCDWERQSQEAFSLAETFITTKDQRK